MKREAMSSDVQFVECLLSADTTSLPTTFGTVSGWTGRNACPAYYELELSAFGNATLSDVYVVGKCPNGRYLQNLVNAGDDVVLTERTIAIDETDINTTTNVITSASHGFTNAQGPVHISSGTTLPPALTANTNYWIIVVNANTFKLATSYANAVAGTAIALPADGTGTHTFHIPSVIHRERFEHNFATTGYSLKTSAHTSGKYVWVRVVPVYKVWIDG